MDLFARLSRTRITGGVGGVSTKSVPEYVEGFIRRQSLSRTHYVVPRACSGLTE